MGVDLAFLSRRVNRTHFSFVLLKALWLCSFDSDCRQIDVTVAAKVALSVLFDGLPCVVKSFFINCLWFCFLAGGRFGTFYAVKLNQRALHCVPLRREMQCGPRGF